MAFDLERVPFSRAGGYLAISHLPEQPHRPEGLYLRCVRGPALGGRPLQEILLLRLTRNDESIPYRVVPSPARLLLQADGGTAEFCFPGADRLQLRLEGVELEFSMDAEQYDTILPGPDGRWQLICHSVCETKLMFGAEQGALVVDAPWDEERCQYIAIRLTPDETTGRGEFTVDEFITNWRGKAAAPFSEACNQVELEFQAWLETMPVVPERYSDTRVLAAYILWSCIVAPNGHLTRPAIYASKNGMLGVWSWDHCFHTLALAAGQPRAAWDQFMVLFDQQDPSGVLPDWLNDRMISWNFVKPPVHGWVLSRLLRHTGLLTATRLQEVYDPLCQWSEWWLTQRDMDHDDIPQCNHGNDGGWDNSSVFAERPPIETPEIAAYLIVQMDFLAEAGRRLGYDSSASAWTRRADNLLERLLAELWTGERFVARRAGSHEVIASESLLPYMTLVLGRRLPARVRAQMIADLKAPGQFLSPHGLATERLTSPLYRAKGYWRGPIWAAPTLIVTDGLDACGETELALDLRRRFCDMAATAGLAENYDAVTGEGYHDWHFSWTAGIFLVLAHELLAAEQRDDAR